MYEVKVKKAINGYMILWDEEIDNDNVVEQCHAIEESYSEDELEEYKTHDEEKIAFGKLVYRLYDFFGLGHDKYGSENLNITFDKKGRKAE